MGKALTARDALARGIWEASRADEGTISYAGANIVADALIASGVVIDVTENVAGRANINDLTYAATALAAGSDNGDRYCAARLRGLVAALGGGQ